MSMSRFPRSGFTFIELSAVLVILGILAALTLPRIGKGTDVAGAVVGASNSGQAANGLARYFVEVGKYPNNYDSLLENEGQSLASILPKKRGTAHLDTDELSQKEYDGFQECGITQVWDLSTDPESKTNNPYVGRTIAGGDTSGNDGGSRTLEEGSSVCILTQEGIKVLGLPAEGSLGTTIRYFAFGLGEKCSMTSTGGSSISQATLVSAPVNFGAASQPDEKYSRFIQIYSYDSDLVTRGVNLNSFDIKYITTASYSKNGLEGVENNIRNYNNTKNYDGEQGNQGR